MTTTPHSPSAPVQGITPRRMQFDFSDDMDLVFIEHDPALSFLFLGTWMLLPSLEPYLMRTMRSAMNDIADTGLLHDLKQFCAQEGQHYQQHARANAVILRRMPPAQRARMQQQLAAIEAQYRQFSATRPLAWNLAYAEGFEAYTAAGARTQLELDVFAYMTDPIRDLMRWHIMEELEHRTVAFDACAALGRGYLHRLRTGLYAQKHFIGLGRQLAGTMMQAFPELVAAHQSDAARQLRTQRRRRYFRRTLRNLVGIYLPWYSPARLRMPPAYTLARAEYDRRVADPLTAGAVETPS
ncbi:MAG: metal-dependent hydrolase [Pseudomonadales bacterium]|nr:metal-dependent hydrolase [Pseudomonadales bacterium]